MSSQKNHTFLSSLTFPQLFSSIFFHLFEYGEIPEYNTPLVLQQWVLHLLWLLIHGDEELIQSLCSSHDMKWSMLPEGKHPALEHIHIFVAQVGHDTLVLLAHSVLREQLVQLWGVEPRRAQTTQVVVRRATLAALRLEILLSLHHLLTHEFLTFQCFKYSRY